MIYNFLINKIEIYIQGRTEKLKKGRRNLGGEGRNNRKINSFREMLNKMSKKGGGDGPSPNFTYIDRDFDYPAQNMNVLSCIFWGLESILS